MAARPSCSASPFRSLLPSPSLLSSTVSLCIFAPRHGLAAAFVPSHVSSACTALSAGSFVSPSLLSPYSSAASRLSASPLGARPPSLPPLSLQLSRGFRYAPASSLSPPRLRPSALSSPASLSSSSLLSRRQGGGDREKRGKKAEKDKRRDAEAERPEKFADWTEDAFLSRAAEGLQSAAERVKVRLAQLRPEPASVPSLEKIIVHVTTPSASGVGAAAAVSAPVRSIVSLRHVSSSTLALRPLDGYQHALAAIEKALSSSSLGVSVSMRRAEGAGAKSGNSTEIFVEFPPLTQERRLQLVNEARAEAEEGRVSLRRFRRDLVEELRAVKKAGGIGEDRIAKLQDRVQQATEKKIAEIDGALTSKEKQLQLK
ncbi:ribosome recycling factor protein [Besnoitia besnoiti]|uniref:Ribosome recycling factor protein n=1 Tax=Besnoitia besnoiti TaxID=94643 RepID=A0A2A9MCU9_BESBE|nr:ribosome recycling factor protein [Besnoitia besnoiti]PFH33202.1 ribosome recycling factor protein [Besnoitia besnoiti]